MVDYLLIGHGVCGRGVLHFLKGRVIVLDKRELAIPASPGRDVSTVQATLTETNYRELLGRYSTPGTIIIECANEVDTADVARWCNANGRHFINTVGDIWRPKVLEWSDRFRRIDDLLWRIVAPLIELQAEALGGATSLIMHGANTGMVNQYLKRAIADLAADADESVEAIGGRVREVYVIEKDTLCFKPGFVPGPDVFYNTWNIKEFILESVARCEFPEHGKWTLRERALQRDVFLDDVTLKARLVQHEECFTMDYYLKTAYGNDRASVQFLYECSPIGAASRIRYPLGHPYSERCVVDEVERGYDLVGTLIRLDDGRAWFTGHRMDNAEARGFFAETNGTAWYVSAGVLAAIDWVKDNRERGVLLPEFSDHDAIIANFQRYANPAHSFSRPVRNLWMSAEYDDIEIPNLYATGAAVLPD
ncbi:MAG: saccharopine dehydrogenase NADP-binding domain-containing protein [Gammaproteobacteria bacterium]